jgi:hypothetical protein
MKEQAMDSCPKSNLILEGETFEFTEVNKKAITLSKIFLILIIILARY